MKVALIAIPMSLGKKSIKFESVQYPVNIGYLASYLIKHGYEVEMWDYNILHFTEESFKEKIRASRPEIVGIHCKTSTILIGERFAKIIKEVNPEIKVIVGGPHSTALPERTLEEFPDFDICVIGEGELTLLELCERIKSKKSLEGTLGISYRAKGAIVVEQKRPLIQNLDELPFPNRDLVDMEKYKTGHVERGLPRSIWNPVEIMVSRGRPYQCIYCAGHLNYGLSVRFRSAKNVIEEVEECIRKYNVNYVNINDDTITLRKDLLYELCDNFKRLSLKWGCLTRVDVITKEMLQRMVDSGCIRMNFGVESGSQRILDLTKKRITIEQIKKAFKYAHEAKLRIIDAGILIGQHPDETTEDVKKSLQLMKEINPTFAFVTITVPFPGTELNRVLKEKGYLKKENWENFVMFGKKPEWRTEHFSAEELVRLQKWVMRKYYLRISYIVPRLLAIRSLKEIIYYLDVGLDFLKNVIINRSDTDI